LQGCYNYDNYEVKYIVTWNDDDYSTASP